MCLFVDAGESQFNQAQRIGGDSGLTGRGEEYARLLPDVLESRLPAVSGARTPCAYPGRVECGVE
jgi:broad specificity phosphatase PhoE